MQSDAGSLLKFKAEPKKKARRALEEQWLWRQAVVLIGQLPDDRDEALSVLEHARKLLEQAPKPA